MCAAASQDLKPMRRTIARNVSWNWVCLAVNLGASFITLPFLLYELGQETYSLWLLIAALTGYFDFFDLGLRLSVGRNIAYHHGRDDRAGVRRVFSTGLTLLLVGSVLVLAGTCAIILVFTSVFDVPPDQIESTHIALFLVGLNLALYFPAYGFEAVFWGYQRFDLSNAIEIPCILLRTLLTFWLLSCGGGLVSLALITLSVTVVSSLTKVIFVRRLAPYLRWRPREVSKAEVHSLLSFGVWTFVLQVTRVCTTRIAEPIIGSLLAVRLVAPYSIAARLVGYVNSILIQTTGILTPLVTALHAGQKHAQVQSLFVQGGRFCLALGLFFLGLFFFLGRAFIVLWTRQEALGDAWWVLMALMVGELLPISQGITYSTALAINRHRLWTVMGLVEVASVITLAFVLGTAQGLVGVALAVAIPGAVCRGLVPMVYVCRVLKVPLSAYVARAVVPALFATLVPTTCLGLLTLVQPVTGWPLLVAYGLITSLLFVISAAVLLLGLERVKAQGSLLLRRLSGAHE
jgi:O-antigen/teichoic acid export membrane protein